MSVRCRCTLVNSSLNLAAQEIRDTSFFNFTWRYRALLRSFAVQGGCIGPETRALLAAILWCHGSQRIMPRDITERVGALLALKLSRCM
jgi:hypothetical protein